MKLRFLLTALLVWICGTHLSFGQSPLATATEYRITNFLGSPSGLGSADGIGSQARFTCRAGSGVTTKLSMSRTAAIIRFAKSFSKPVRSPLSPVRQESADPLTAPPAPPRFGFVEGIWGDGTNLYVCDVGNRTIRQVDISSGNVTTIAGTAGLQNITDGVGAAARFIAPGPIWGDGTNLFIADVSNLARVIRRLTISTRQVTTIANLSVVPNGPTFLGVWGDGSNLYIADAAAHAIRRVALGTNQITTLAGSLLNPGTADGSAASARFNTPSGIWGDGTDLFVGDGANRTIRRVSIATGDTTTIAGLAGQPGVSDGIGPAARFQFAAALWGVGTSVYIADYSSSTIRQIDTATTAVTTVAGSASVSGIADGTGPAARFAGPTMLTGDGNNLYIVDTLASTIRKSQSRHRRSDNDCRKSGRQHQCRRHWFGGELLDAVGNHGGYGQSLRHRSGRRHCSPCSVTNVTNGNTRGECAGRLRLRRRGWERRPLQHAVRDLG